jgi:hypothetical protein
MSEYGSGFYLAGKNRFVPKHFLYVCFLNSQHGTKPETNLKFVLIVPVTTKKKFHVIFLLTLTEHSDARFDRILEIYLEKVVPCLRIS